MDRPHWGHWCTLPPLQESEPSPTPVPYTPNIDDSSRNLYMPIIGLILLPPCISTRNERIFWLIEPDRRTFSRTGSAPIPLNLDFGRRDFKRCSRAVGARLGMRNLAASVWSKGDFAGRGGPPIWSSRIESFDAGMDRAVSLFFAIISSRASSICWSPSAWNTTKAISPKWSNRISRSCALDWSTKLGR
jgi:hypothetical protein